MEENEIIEPEILQSYQLSLKFSSLSVVAVDGAL